MKFITKLTKNIHYAVLVLYGAFEAFILSRIAMFGDDYYYSTFFRGGFSHFLSENTRHYMETNGRALVHVLDEVLIKNGRMLPFKVFASEVLLLMPFFMALICAEVWRDSENVSGERFRVSLVLSCVLCSFVPIETARQTLYWATGFMNYVFPVFLTLVLAFFALRGLAKGKFGFFLVPLAFFASCTTEQAAFSAFLVLVFALVCSLVRGKGKNLSKTLVVSLVFSLVGLAALFLAPGNAVRITYYPDFYAMPFFARIFHNAERIAKLFFREAGGGFYLSFFFASFAVLAAGKKGNGKTRTACVLNIAGAALPYASSVFDSHEFLEAETVISVLLLVYDMVLLLLKSAHDKKMPSAAFLFTFLASVCQCAMLVSPEMGPRTVFITLIFLSVAALSLLFAAAEEKPRSPLLVSVLVLALGTPLGTAAKAAFTAVALLCSVLLTIRRKTLGTAAALVIACLLMVNALSAFYVGYAENYPIHKANDARIAEYRNNKESGELVLTELPNDTYRYAMPYNDPYQMYWYKKAHRLDTKTDVTFVPFKENVR